MRKSEMHILHIEPWQTHILSHTHLCMYTVQAESHTVHMRATHFGDTFNSMLESFPEEAAAARGLAGCAGGAGVIR